MSETQDAPPAVPSHLAPQKKVSGLLVVSIVLTLAGIFVIPLIATVGALICAVKGRKKALADPLLIGPRFGMFCIIAALLALPVNAWQIYGIWDNLDFQKASSEAIEAVFRGLRARKYEQAYDALDESYRAAHTLDEFTAEMTAAFPGTGDLVLGQETISVRGDEFTEDEKNAWVAFFQKKETDTLDHTSRILAAEGPVPTNLDIRLLIRRNGYADYSVRVMSVRAWPAESPAEAAPKPDEPPETPSETPEEDAPGDDPK